MVFVYLMTCIEGILLSHLKILFLKITFLFMKGISIDCFYNPYVFQENIFDKIFETLLGNGKITKQSYSILKKQDIP